jgi:hypothetical protein
VELHAAAGRPDQALDDHRVLVPLVLDEERVPRLVDELGDPLPPVAGAPDEAGALAGIESLPVPVGLETLDDLVHLVAVRRDHGVVAGLRQVLRRPVEGLDERGRIVHHHRLLVRQVDGGVAGDHVDARVGELLAHHLVVFLAAPAGGIEHHPHLHAATVRGDDGVHQRRVGEDEHLDPERLLGDGDRVEDGLGRVVGEDDQ